MKHIKARFDSTCIACSQVVKQGEKIVLMHTQDFNRNGFPEAWRGKWIHKQCKKNWVVGLEVATLNE